MLRGWNSFKTGVLGIGNYAVVGNYCVAHPPANAGGCADKRTDRPCLWKGASLGRTVEWDRLPEINMLCRSVAEMAGSIRGE